MISFDRWRSGSSGSDTTRSRRLDGIRGLAALGVLVYHCISQTGLLWAIFGRSRTIGGFIGNSGMFCVTVFFALSGFLLFREFLSGILFDDSPPRIRHYLTRRGLRIYPAYWAALLGYVLLIGVQGSGAFGLVTLTARSLDSTSNFVGLPVAWTLYIEVAFYLFLPIAALILRRICRWRPVATRVRIVIGSLIGLLVFSLVWIFLVDALANNDVRLVYNLPPYFGWFAAGMGLAVLHRCHQQGLAIAPGISRLAQRPWWCWGGALVLILCLTPMKVIPQFGESTIQLQVRLLLSSIAAFLVILPLVLPSQPSRIHSVTGSRQLAWVGVVSYGVYLWHQTFAIKLEELFSDSSSLGSMFVNSIILTALVLPISLLIGWVSYRVIEKPAMSLAPNRAPNAGP